MPSLDELAQKGIEAINDKRFTDAIEAFEAALALDPARPDMTNALGMAHLHRGDAGNAVPYLEKSIELAEPFDQPEHDAMKQHFHQALATAYQLLDQVADARRVLEGMVERWPDNVETRLQLGHLLMAACLLDDGVAVYNDVVDLLDKENREAIEAVVGSLGVFADSEHEADIFLQAHQESYVAYFDSVAEAQEQQGWYAEAARMAKGEDGEMRPIVAEGAKPYALTRVDLVNPNDGNVAHVYTENEPMVVAVEGLEPLAQVGIMLPWKSDDFRFDVWVCTRSPWHWLNVTFQFRDPGDESELIARIDELVGDWYLKGWNGEFGDKDAGRFHYITDPEVVGDRAVAYTVDLGRASYDAVTHLLRRLVVLNDTHALQRVLFGYGRLPD